MKTLIPNQRPAPRARFSKETIEAAHIVKKVLATNDTTTEEGRLVATSQLLYRLDKVGFINLSAVTK